MINGREKKQVKNIYMNNEEIRVMTLVEMKAGGKRDVKDTCISVHHSEK